jgi:Tol biopolymer transport system component
MHLRGLLALGASSLALLAVATGPASATFPGANGRLVFVQWTQQTNRFDTPSAFLCSADPDGGRVSRLSAGDGRDGHPAFSPGGDRVAFTHGASTDIGELRVADADGGGVQRIGDFFAGWPSWTADGSGLFVVRDGDVWLIGSPSATATRVTQTAAFEADPAASPDGTRVAFARDGELVVRRLADGQETRPAPGRAARDPDWSPDSSRIVFASTNELYTVGADGTGLASLGSGADPAYSPDGTMIAFVDGADVWTMRADGSGQVNLTRSPVVEDDPAWQPLPSPSTPRAAGTAPCAIVGTEGNDVLVGTEERDVFYDLGGDDLIRGLGGNDVVWDGAGADVIETGDGDDLVQLGAGRNTLRLGAGDDEVLQTMAAADGSAIDGEAGDDRIEGSTAGDRLLGGEGNDVINGLRGPDIVFAGPGNDRAAGNRGDDYLDGGLGDDVLYGGLISGLPAKYDGYDVLLGRGGADRIAGGWQKDRLFGGTGADRLSGGPNADRLEGNEDPDTLLGDSGDDLVLARRGGRDAVWGGSGFDRATADRVDRVRGVERRLP